MKSEWRVTSQVIGGISKYAVYRLLNVNAVDHASNREYAGDYIDCKKSAQFVADRLNEINEPLPAATE